MPSPHHRDLPYARREQPLSRENRSKHLKQEQQQHRQHQPPQQKSRDDAPMKSAPQTRPPTAEPLPLVEHPPKSSQEPTTGAEGCPPSIGSVQSAPYSQSLQEQSFLAGWSLCYMLEFKQSREDNDNDKLFAVSPAILFQHSSIGCDVTYPCCLTRLCVCLCTFLLSQKEHFYAKRPRRR